MEVSKQKLAERNAKIAEMEAANKRAEDEIKERNRIIGMLMDAQEYEKRILVLLNYLAQRPDEDRQNLLRIERESQAPILHTLETHWQIS